jgi:3-deoxy-7-phosphoheptulonate synthase
MIIQLQPNLRQDQQEALRQALTDLRIESYPVTTQAGSYLVCVAKSEFDIRHIGGLPGVRDIHRVSGPHKLVSSKWKVGRTSIRLENGAVIGDGHLAVMAGPCSIESERQMERVADSLVKEGVRIMRGGAFKPRTNPYSFRGLGIEGLKTFYEICRSRGIAIITEVMEASQIEPMLPYVDIFQIGARNSQNFNLLEALGEVDKAVLIKRGISGTIDELLYSAEYVFKKGNEKILLCERGIRSFETAYRNTLDLNAVPILQEKSHLPVIVDPSHGIGIRKHVIPMTLAGIAAGADGVIVEMDEVPEKAATDGAQTIDFREFEELMKKIRVLRAM